MNADEATRLNAVSLGQPLSADGHTFSISRPRPGWVDQFAGVIRSGPATSSGADYADARYYVDRAVPSPAQGSGDPLSVDVDRLPGVSQTVTATNLAELPDGTHSLAAGTIVQVSALYTRGAPAEKVYVFHHAPDGAVTVRIDSAAAGAGEYDGTVLTGRSTATESSDLSMPAGLSAMATPALILNVEESGETGHRVAPGSFAVGVMLGPSADQPGKTIVAIRGGVGAASGGTSIGGDSNGSETADSSTWSRTTDATPVTVYLVSRVVYNPGGDMTIYAFFRQLAFDARGLLLSISGESRYTVTPTETCP